MILPRFASETVVSARRKALGEIARVEVPLGLFPDRQRAVADLLIQILPGRPLGAVVIGRRAHLERDPIIAAPRAAVQDQVELVTFGDRGDTADRVSAVF